MVSYDNPIVYRDDPMDDCEEPMEFRLTYEGKLASSRSNCDAGYISSRIEHKHDIRRHFHNQLRNLWEFNPITRHFLTAEADPGEKSLMEQMYRKSEHFSWIPLINEKMSWECDLEILYLRHGARGSVLNESDIDNRIKTLLDALKMPKLGEIHDSARPSANETPFFTLLEDDKVISRLSVETDMLFSPNHGVEKEIDSRIVIKVKTRPYILPWMVDIAKPIRNE